MARIRRRLLLALAFEIVLQQQPDALRAAVVLANRVDAVGVTEADLPDFVVGPIAQRSPDTRMPAARLFHSREVIDRRRRREHCDVPILLRPDGNQIIAAEQREPARRDFLKIISGNAQGKFRRQRQRRAEAIRAETVGLGTGARGDADEKSLLRRQRVRQQRAAPKKMRIRIHLTITAEPVSAAVVAKLPLVPSR